MIERPSATALLALALVALAGCSKTEDSAPDRTIFGVPPVIESASLEVNPNATAVCDFNDAFNYKLGLDGLSLSVPTTITAKYTQLTFRMRVSDPDSTPDRTDILAATASFKDSTSASTPIEDSLVLLDDGSSQKFPFKAKSVLFPQDCSTSGGVLSCQQATYEVTSGDPVAADGNYTRHFYFARTPDVDQLIQDCVARENHIAVKAIQFAEVSFLLEAVDRAGNLAVWPDELTSIDEGISLQCAGDECFCCGLLQGPDFASFDCLGLPGLVSADFPDGLCRRSP